MPQILSTLETSQGFRFWLNDLAYKNIWNISTTCDTCQDDRSWLKDTAFLNNPDMLVTAETSQVDIGPYIPGQSPFGDSRKHDWTAFESSVSD